MTIAKIQDGATITLQVDGRVDTNTSPQLQKEVLNALQTAKVLQLDLGTVKSRISRARNSLRKILLENGNLSGYLPSNQSENERREEGR